VKAERKPLYKMLVHLQNRYLYQEGTTAASLGTCGTRKHTKIHFCNRGTVGSVRYSWQAVEFWCHELNINITVTLIGAPQPLT